jgi:type I restriction enzyme, S subunit
MKEYKLSEIATIENGGTPSTEIAEYWNGHIPWITPYDLSKSSSKWIKNGERSITKEGVKASNAKLVPARSIMVSTRAPIGYIVMNEVEATTNQGMKSVIPNNDVVNSEYLYYLLKTKVKVMNMKAGGTTFKEISTSVFKGLKFMLPDMEEQNEIGYQLSKLDEKIELSRELMGNLEEYSRLLFHKWFIDFNFPDVNGKPYKDYGGEMVETEESVIPLSWYWENICNVADIVDCLHSKKPNNDGKNPNKCLLQLENISHFGLLNLRNLYMVNDKVYSTWTNRIEVKEGDIIVTNAGRVGAIAQIPKGYKFGIGRNITAIRPKLISPTWFYLYFTSKTIQSQIKRNTDKGSFFGSLNVRGIKQLQILVPKREIIVEFEKQAKPIRDKIELLNEEIQKLEEIRDLLINKLIK